MSKASRFSDRRGSAPYSGLDGLQLVRRPLAGADDE